MPRVGVSLVGFVGLMLLSSLPSLAADPTPVPLAEKTYMRYCASCHGKDGTGNGPVARHMKPPPINLTLLSKNNGGQFPYDHVLSVIELRADVPAHGFQDQPVWGDGLSILDQIGPMGAGSENRGKIEALTQYIKSIQQK